MRLRHGLPALGALIAIAIAGCGAGVGGRPGGSVLPRSAPTAAVSPALPVGWGTLRLPSGVALPYPAGWQQIGGDPGSASAALFEADGKIRAYLNATPAEGRETVADWARFRLRHNAAEGDRNVRLITAQTPLGLASGRESCVVDDYSTSRSKFRELACILAPADGRHATVLVAAAEQDAWAREHPVLEFAVSHFVS
jgi:hypothetical protein